MIVGMGRSETPLPHEYPIRRVQESRHQPLERSRWPATVPAVAQLLDQGLELGRATVLVGENGSGKSTLVESVALAFGLSPEGGSTGARHSTRTTESELADHLQLIRAPGSSRRGFFLRAETMHGFYTYLEQNPRMTGAPDIDFHSLSHGESFLELVGDRFRGSGLWVLDEPESALSFQGSLSLLATLKEIVDDPESQVLLSTHSPILAALPGALVLEVGPWGLRPRQWEDLELVANWRNFLSGPDRFLRHF